MSALFHGKTLTESLPDQLKIVGDLENNQLFLQQAKQGIYPIAMFSPVVSQSIEEIVEKHGKAFDAGVKVLVIASDPSELSSRHISWGLLRAVSLEIKDSKLNIFTGDSGSGKTTTAIATALERRLICVHVTLDPKMFGDSVLVQERGRRGHSPPEGNWRNLLVATKLKRLLRDSSRLVSKRSRFGVAVIIDELGGFPLVLRSLCSMYGELTDALKNVFQTDHVEIYACGTGCDSNANRPGSSVAMYNIIDMSSKLHREGFCADILGKLSALSEYFKQDSAVVSAADAATISSVKALLMNRRVAAAFLSEAVRLFNIHPNDPAIQWRHMALHLANAAVLCFKGLNGLRSYNFGVPLNRLFSRALAHALGGPEQLMTEDDEDELIRRCGLVTDNARRFPVKCEEMGIIIKGKCRKNVRNAAKRSQEILALPKGVVHRYAVSSAQLEMFRMGFGVSTRPRSGAGFEQTVCDFLMVLLCAHQVGGTIAPVPQDPLADLKERVREACAALSQDTGTLDVVVSLQLSKRARRLSDCRDELTRALSGISTGKPNPGATRFAAVLLNGPRAPAADVFVAVGTFSCSKASAPPHLDIRLGFPVQCKHFECSTLTEVQIGFEWYKCGSRCRPACLAEVVSKVRRSSKEMAPVVNRVLDEVEVAVTKEELAAIHSTMEKYASGPTVRRGKMLRALLNNASILPRLKADCDDAVVICLSKAPLQLSSDMMASKGFLNLTMEVAHDAFYPVALGELPTGNKIMDWSTVSFY
jgi:hypothetical protein